MSTLTVREIEVLRAIGRHGPYRAAAKALGISEHTVKNLLDSMREKLGVMTTAQAIYRVFVEPQEPKPKVMVCGCKMGMHPNTLLAFEREHPQAAKIED